MLNEKLGTREQEKLGIRNEELGKRLTHKPILIPNSYFLITQITFLFSIFSCNLLSAPPDPNYFDKIDGEIAWANAKKLNVYISYDREWGTSNTASGQITPLNVTSCSERLYAGGIAGKFYSTTGTSDDDAPIMRMVSSVLPVLAGTEALPILAALWDWSAVQSI